MTNHEETKALTDALTAWLHSQDANPKHAIPAMLEVCGAMIGMTAKNLDGALERINMCNGLVMTVAIQAFIKKEKGK